LENLLKKRLALIKARANRLKRFRLLDSITGGSEREASINESKPARGMTSGRLEELVQGEERTVDGQQFYLIRLKGPDIDEWAEKQAIRFRSPRKEQAEMTENPLIGSPVGAEPIEVPKENVCFFDIETTGLTPNTYVFLCGMMFIEENDFIFEQAFARDYEEESGMLQYVQKKFEEFGAVVTFNGKSFDIPFVKTRMVVNRIEFDERFHHVDLLYFARRAYGGVLENCKLQTIETHLRSQMRTGDIPGSQIPAAYHDFVRTGEAGSMARVLYHNQMDLLTMAILYNQLWPGTDIK
jgi:uncharacterized protein YprB with RNaseH-like and TPR domain